MIELSGLQAGTELPPLTVEPISRATLALFAGASGDHNPIHIDLDVARSAGLDDVFAHGMLSMAYLGRLLTDWVPQERLRSWQVRFTAITPVHGQPTCTGKVVIRHRRPGHREAGRHPGRRDRHPGRRRRHRPELKGRTDMGKLDGKVAIVTGAGRGIGAEIARKLAGDGAAVVVNDLDEGPANQTVTTITTAGGRAVACAGSVTEAGFAERFTGTAVDSFGGLDIIVNNAGYTWDSVIQKMSDEQWDAILDVHLKAPFRILRAAQPVISGLVKQARARRPAGTLPQGGQHLLHRRPGRQRRAGQLRRGQGGHHRPDQGPGQGMGPVQRHRQHGGVRPDQDQAHRGPGRRRTPPSTSRASRSRSGSTPACSPRWSR